MKSRVSDQKREVRNVEAQSKILMQRGPVTKEWWTTPLWFQISPRVACPPNFPRARVQGPLSTKLETSRSLPGPTVDPLLVRLLIWRFRRFKNVFVVWNFFHFVFFYFKVEAIVLSQLVMDVYECWKIGQKYEQYVKVPSSSVSQFLWLFLTLFFFYS